MRKFDNLCRMRIRCSSNYSTKRMCDDDNGTSANNTYQS